MLPSQIPLACAHQTGNASSLDRRRLRGLNVLHISAMDNVGGSGRSAYRVHAGLKRLGARSRMFVGWKSADADEDVDLIGAHKLWVADRIVDRLTQRLSLQYLGYPSSFALRFRRWFREADVVQLYNTHGGYFSHMALPFLSSQRPVVWRLSDMWAMTGHCVYSYECERWKTGCGSCPILADYPALRHDRTALLWRIKHQVYRRSFLTIVAPSRWIAGLAQESPLMRDFPVHVIPNGLDVNVFRPIPQRAAREVLGLDPEKRFILFGAHYASERRKGGLLLTQALEQLASAGQISIELLVIGRDAQQWEGLSRFPVRSLGPLHDDQLLATVYSAADVFVLPTMADNSPNGIIESMACGTPVVSFGVGGVPELVRHLETGYLAKPQDATDLAKGLQMLLDDAPLRSRMGQRCREVVEQEYTVDLQARRFLDLYYEVIERDGVARRCRVP